MAGTAKLKINQGATFKKVLTCKSEGVPIDLTGSSIIMSAAAEGVAAMAFSTASGHIVLTDATLGKFTITLSKETTLAFTWSTAKFNLLIIFSNGDAIRLLEGTLKLDKKV